MTKPALVPPPNAVGVERLGTALTTYAVRYRLADGTFTEWAMLPAATS